MRRSVVLGFAFACAFAPGSAFAFEPFAALVPCRATAENTAGTVRPCITCHNNPDGGGGCAEPPCFNDFGMAFRANGTTWDANLAAMDSDLDGYTNGEELGDPSGAWRAGMEAPGTCGCATRPGFASYTPGDVDADDDVYCCRGYDTSGDGDCLDEGEHDGTADCDDAVATSNPGAPELCTNLVDDDCDALVTVLDPDCANVLDRDGDGYCPTGQDGNADGDCIDVGEDVAVSDCDDTRLTVNPGAFENCIDTFDNDCDGSTDLDDSQCTGDADADDDGYCPVGRDLDDDGNCLGEGEPAAGFDCDDTNALANPEEVEVCDDSIDNDCDALPDFRDETCRGYFDADMDGYCPLGRDGNADSDCIDVDEVVEPGDCNDEDATIHPAALEICINAIDDDCDGAVSLADVDCATYLDTDGDRYCFVGFDMNRDSDCADDGEDTGNSDCDEASALVNPGSVELCTNAIDDDCDGSMDAFDQPICDDYRDRDGDGWCAVGRVADDDGDCADEGEAEEPNDSGHDAEPTVYPGAPENCFDGLDNDLDASIDEAAACVSDTDADDDGYCPVGRDVNGDGDCLDARENLAAGDCNDGDPEVNPGADEACRDNVDRNCDGDVGLIDPDCYYLLDRDHDGFCGEGIDDNSNGSCLDEGEDRFGVDCDDANARINTRAVEVCDNMIDDDCDTRVDLLDPSCPCDANEQCDDGDPCTSDRCAAEICEFRPLDGCGDAGPRPRVDGGTEPPPPSEDCACRAVGAPRETNLGWLIAGVIAFALVRRRRR